jgi:hypothetical protein
VLVLCMPAQAFGSDWATLESQTFRFRDPLNKERRFIPLRLDAAPLIVIRTSEGEVRWMEVRDFLKRASNNVKKPVKQIVFKGNAST